MKMVNKMASTYERTLTYGEKKDDGKSDGVLKK